MAGHPGLRHSLPPLVIALILLGFTVTGLAAGVGVRHLVDGLARSSASHNSLGDQGASTTPTATVSPTATAQPSPSVRASETVTAGVGYTGFSLSASVSPPVVATGGQFTVRVTVLAKSGAKLAGVPCTLAPQGGGEFPFTPAPTTKLSDAQGVVSWTLTASGASPGTYILRVEGTGTLEYLWYTYVTVQVSG